MCLRTVSMSTCSSPYWSGSGRWGELIGIEAPAGVQAVWLELLTLPRCFSWWQVTRAKALPETQCFFHSLSCDTMKNVLWQIQCMSCKFVWVFASIYHANNRVVSHPDSTITTIVGGTTSNLKVVSCSSYTYNHKVQPSGWQRPIIL